MDVNRAERPGCAECRRIHADTSAYTTPQGAVLMLCDRCKTRRVAAAKAREDAAQRAQVPMFEEDK